MDENSEIVVPNFDLEILSSQGSDLTEEQLNGMVKSAKAPATVKSTIVGVSASFKTG